MASAIATLWARKIYDCRNDKKPRYTIDDVNKLWKDEVIKILKDTYDYEV